MTTQILSPAQRAALFYPPSDAAAIERLLGPGDTSSSAGQLFRAGGRGEARADHNAR